MWTFYFYKGTREPPHAILRPCGFQRPSVSTAAWLANCEFRAWKRGTGPAQRVYKAAALTTSIQQMFWLPLTQLLHELFMGIFLTQPRQLKSCRETHLALCVFSSLFFFFLFKLHHLFWTWLTSGIVSRILHLQEWCFSQLVVVVMSVADYYSFDLFTHKYWHLRHSSHGQEPVTHFYNYQSEL